MSSFWKSIISAIALRGLEPSATTSSVGAAAPSAA